MANICFLKKLFNVISHQENANKIYYSQKYLFWIVSSKKIKTDNKNKEWDECCQGSGEKTALSTVGVSVNWYNEYGLQQRYLCIRVHAAFIHSSQEMEPA